ncbi:ankyrin repeats (3 copies) domain-containing protein [Pochonia chlamydosporia 170]|uniref:Ankyrin repeats (3 copies) domain-containing protein n=1 Tax=Pochonia chlamydosporia 170 TaxID=1380566 RepID=A0A179G418_METCM|nr:ankyrin repeats (3 copies) domain-containing protein [Pochonia chlamydosporia 170]OAQ72091.1 ankyrin repeats (3 copies) domain-containing protein [Pochonia chlamydosporia 170]
MSAFLPDLPNELLCALAAYLPDLGDLAALLRTNRQLHSHLNSELYKCDARNKEKSRAIPWAVQHGRFDTLRHISTASASHWRAKGMTVLHLAATYNQKAMAEAFLDLPSIGVDDKEDQGFTALHLAAASGSVEVAKVLLDKGADPNVLCESDEISPLGLASMFGSIEVAELLLQHGADVNEGDAEQPPLFYAVGNEKTDVVKLLLEHGASMEFPSTEPGCTTALIQAANLGHADIVATLISHGADPLQSDTNGDTPLSMAIATTGKRRVEAVQMLLKNGAEAELTQNGGITALRQAVGSAADAQRRAWDEDADPDTEKESLELVRLLLDHGAVASASDDHGTALHCAVTLNYQKIAELLLRNNVPVNATNSEGMTALHFAVSPRCSLSPDECVDMVQLLVSNGADARALDNRGQTPLHIAAGLSLEISEILLKVSNAVADDNVLAARDYTGRTALHNSARFLQRNDHEATP